jgi:large subunit ribosomal protein L13
MKKTPMLTRKDALAQREWVLVDAEGKPLGRLATRVATLLRGKHKATFVPYLDAGDFVIVINAGKVRLTGKKAENKIYYRHTGYPGGLREVRAEEFLLRKPEFLITTAVRGMLPRNRLGRDLLKKLKVYPGPEHPHAAQKPAPYEAF